MTCELPRIESVLSASHSYARLEPELLALLVPIAKLVTLEGEQRLFSDGDSCPGVFVLHSGVVRLCNTAPSGKMHILFFATAGDSFAEAAVVGDFACPVDADVIKAGLAVRIEAAGLRALLAREQRLCFSFLQVMSRRNQLVTLRTRDITLRDAAGRVASFLLERAQSTSHQDTVVPLVVAKNELAKHLNVTTETLSRVLRRLTAAGVIEHKDHHELRITDMERLRTFV